MRIDTELARQAERSVLGAFMLSGEATQHMAKLSPADFINPTNAKVFSAMQELHSAGTAIDLVTVHHALSAAGIEVGERGLDYLMELGDAVPSAANVEHYITVVVQNGREHRINRALARIIEGDESSIHQLERLITEEKAARRDGRRSPATIIANYLDSLVEEPATTLFTTGLPRLDNDMGGFPRGSVSAIAARPRVGKTSFALNIALHNINRGHKSTFFSLEMPERQILDRVAAMVARVPYSSIHKRTQSPSETTTICEELPQLATGARLNIIDDTYSVSAIIEEIDRLRPDISFIDYIQRVRPDRATDSRHHDIEAALYRLKEAAIRYDCHIGILSQISRAGTDKPRLEHLKESGAIEEASDIVAILHRMTGPDGRTPGPNGVLTVEKHKYGQPGFIDIMFDGRYQRFSEATNRQEGT